MCRGISFLLVLLALPLSNAIALSIRNEGSNSSAPFELTYQDVHSSLVIVLQVANESGATATVLSWQLVELELRPLGGAQGELNFQSVTAPPDSLFGQSPGPQSDLTMPSATVSALDVDPNFVGVPVTPNSVRNICQLTLGASPVTAGAFQLLMPEVNNPEADSSWFDAEQEDPQLAATPFANSSASAFAGFVLLGTINVGEPFSFQPGDYNLDTRVDSADYDQWRSEFGNSVTSPGDGADGNRDGVVDAADYVVWRGNAVIQGSFGANVSGATVPEPGTLTLLILGWASITSARHGLRRCRSGHAEETTKGCSQWQDSRFR